MSHTNLPPADPNSILPHETRICHEDIAVMVLGAIILCVAWFGITASSSDALTNKPTLENSLKGKVAKLETWTSNPVDAFYAKPKEKDKPASFIGG
jgi:hypothetical protein